MPRTTWYPLLGSMFRELLTPLGGVHVDDRCPLPILTRPYLHDFLLLRRDTPNWSPEQQRRLPDAICDSTKNHILITFYTRSSGNSLTWGLQELTAIGHFYYQSYNLAVDVDEWRGSYYVPKRYPHLIGATFPRLGLRGFTKIVFLSET